MKYLIMAMSLLSLAGCEEVIQPYSPKGQVRDFKICEAAGMGARLDIFNTVKCDPSLPVKVKELNP